MSSSRRARIFRAEEEDAPSADVLRFVPPEAYLTVRQNVRSAFDGRGAHEGFELARALSGFDPGTLAVALRNTPRDASDESGRMIQNCAFAFDYSQEKVRSAVCQRRAPRRKLRRWRIGLGLRMRQTLALQSFF